MKANPNVLVNISHSSCACNGDHVGLLIETGSIQKERTVTQTTIHNFYKCQGLKRSQNWWGRPNVGHFTHKEMSYLVVGLFDDLVAPLSYLSLGH